MLEKFIKKDKNEELEKILEKKNIDEQAKNLLQGILYKIEVSYKDYKKAKVTEVSEEKYVEEILRNIQEKCNKIEIRKVSEKLEDEKIQNELEKNKFYIGIDEIISYPIEKKLLYAVEKKANNYNIVNNKYGIVSKPLSDLINTGKSIGNIEVLRDFNGWSWTTIKKEIENITANLIYQNLRLLLGEELLESWTQDIDGIIDYFAIIKNELIKKYGEKMAEDILDKIGKIAIINEAEENIDFRIQTQERLEEIEKTIEKFEHTKEHIQKISENKKEASNKIKEIEKILSQESRLKKEYEKRNAELEPHKKIFSIKVLKQQLNDKKQRLLNEIEEYNYLLNPVNYVNEKDQLIKQKELLEIINYDSKQKEMLILEFEELFLQCFLSEIRKEEQPEKITNLLYKFRYFMLLPFNYDKNIKDVEELRLPIERTEKELVKVAIKNKVIENVPFEVMKHVFETRIIILEELYYKITNEFEKYYVQIFDENISEERFEITKPEKLKINKKIKICI